MAPLVGQLTLLPTCHQCGKMIMHPHPVQMGRAKLGWPVYCGGRCRRRFHYLKSTRPQRYFRQFHQRDNYLRAFRLGAFGANGVLPDKQNQPPVTWNEFPRQPHGAAIAWQRGLDVGRMVRYSRSVGK